MSPLQLLVAGATVAIGSCVQAAVGSAPGRCRRALDRGYTRAAVHQQRGGAHSEAAAPNE